MAKHPNAIGQVTLHKVDPKAIQIVEGWNPRMIFDTEADAELRDSIIANGVLQPLTVRRDGDALFLIDGERRLRATPAAIEAGHDIQGIPCKFERKTLSQTDAMIMALVSNTGKPLDPVEEAGAMARLKKWGMSADDIAARLGKSRAHVYQQLKLDDAAPAVKKAVQKKEISAKAARQIVQQSGGDIQTQQAELKEAKAATQVRKAAKKKGKKSDTTDPTAAPGEPKAPPVTRQEAERIFATVDAMRSAKNSGPHKEHLEGVLIGMTMLLDGLTFAKAKKAVIG